MEKTALVTGANGYLGSHICKYLQRDGWNVFAFDNNKKYSHSYYNHIDYYSDIRDKQRLRSIFSEHSFDTVFHLAGRIEVGESMKHPTEFWDVNVAGTANLLNVMNEYGVKKIIFSSTAAVYEPTSYPIKEHWPLANNSVYGNTKIACERMIQDSHMKYGIFRYFNLAGCDDEADIGENHEPETHLIPNIFKNLNSFVVNGIDYNTPDGTCIRDYVHVGDIARAHINAAKYIENNQPFILNLGTGVGHSILDIIKMIEEVTGEKVKYTIGAKRLGDPDTLVANINRAKELLGYEPRYDIRSIIETAYKWHQLSLFLNADIEEISKKEFNVT